MLVAITVVTVAWHVLPPLRVQRQQNLDFQQLLPGAPNRVAWSDPLRAGQYQVRGDANAEVLIDFLLPPDLLRNRATPIPLTFGPGDAAFAPDGNLASAIPFDPSVPTTVRLPASGRGFILIGGTANPPVQATTGRYRARISLTVTYTGN